MMYIGKMQKVLKVTNEKQVSLSFLFSSYEAPLTLSAVSYNPSEIICTVMFSYFRTRAFQFNFILVSRNLSSTQWLERESFLESNSYQRWIWVNFQNLNLQARGGQMNAQVAWEVQERAVERRQVFLGQLSAAAGHF